jgi:hypothetical protein
VTGTGSSATGPPAESSSVLATAVSSTLKDRGGHSPHDPSEWRGAASSSAPEVRIRAEARGRHTLGA